ncbi:magnesium/cobalt transporter CorA [Nocardioides campestrisoli]|uniref:magnesium/cobalt transporter CorA n=1 Tax=Nocardioides campestrisoli TaxID=2736757 RepID=UPI0015E707C9|nr:magnesium/cobalt transporter CorA [Nocardioides campestrisoli]
MIVDNAVYRAGHRIEHDKSVDDVVGVSATRQPGDFQWVGLHDPAHDEMQSVASTFGLHPLAVDDAVNAHQRPKLERYDEMIFMVVKTLWYVDELDAVETGEIAVFVGADYVVTVRHGDGSDLQASRRDLESRARLLAHGPTAVLYAVCDKVVDDYELVAAGLEVDIDEIETSVFSGSRDVRSRDAERIYTLKREIAEVRRAAHPLREPMRLLSIGHVLHVSDEGMEYFRDVSDHLIRFCESVDSMDSLLSSAFDAHVSQISLQQNEDMRKISAAAALVVVPTLIAGVYGMNFDYMPELGWHYGYPFSLAMMIGVAAGLYVWFKKVGWL